jgi:rhodanese-related sulfurtransferase
MKKQFILSFALVCLSTWMLSAQNRIETNSLQVQELIKTNHSLGILDVRTADEFNAGHVKGAKNIDITSKDAFSKIDKLKKDKPYLVYCRTHRRSDAAVDYMMKKGFRLVYQMTDGFSGWEKNNLPIAK